MADENRAVELQAQLRDLALPWEAGLRLAFASAVQAVHEMRAAFNEFAETDPYETGMPPEFWDLSAPLKESDPGVSMVAATFMLILNRRGLLKIDLTADPAPGLQAMAGAERREHEPFHMKNN
jgi:hypothetical protein